jgi:histidine triad (HIT) family protein
MCVFCKIIAGDIPADKVYENENILAFKDISPQAPTHFLVIPKKHIETLMDVSIEDQALLGEMMYVGQELAKKAGHEEQGARFVMNCKEWGGQEVYHIHLHVMAGRPMARMG